MDISILLARVLGLYLIITAIALLLRHKALRRKISTFSKGDNAMMIWFFGAFTLIIGLLMVLSHNIWEKDYRVIITIFGWLTLIKGVALMAFPWGWFDDIVRWINKIGWYRLWAIVGLILGAYLLNQGMPLF